jgi:hypothetical protein
VVLPHHAPAADEADLFKVFGRADLKEVPVIGILSVLRE